MTTQQLLLSGWTWNPAVLAISAAVTAAYLAAFRFHARFCFFIAALVAVLLAMISPIETLADGYLFSAHMAQHILLLLIAPALLLLSLPRSFSLPGFLRRFARPVAGWIAGVGAMWIWHAPALCNSAVSSKPVFVFQTLSLLAFGGAFWWQILAPRESQRLAPLTAILYLASACIGCSVLGIIFTFSPVTVCSIYAHPADRLGLLATIRDGWGITPEKDQQLGGLLKWPPMCLVYLGAIFGQLARWFSEPAPAPFRTENEVMPDELEEEPEPEYHTPRPGWEPLEHKRLPRPTYFPSGLAMGAAFIFWGLITSWVIFAVGIGLFVAALAGWISEIRHERKYHATSAPLPPPDAC